jgi:hypothetical protein
MQSHRMSGASRGSQNKQDGSISYYSRGRSCAADAEEDIVEGDDIVSIDDETVVSGVRFDDFSSKWKVTHWKSVNATAFFRTNPAKRE